MAQTDKRILLIVTTIFFVALQLKMVAQTDNSKREGNMADPAINPIYNYYEWENEIQEDCPSEKSRDIKKVVFSGHHFK